MKEAIWIHLNAAAFAYEYFWITDNSSINLFFVHVFIIRNLAQGIVLIILHCWASFYHIVLVPENCKFYHETLPT